MPKSDQGVGVERFSIIPRALVFVTRQAAGESRVLLIKGAPTLVASLISGDIEIGYTGGTAVLGGIARSLPEDPFVGFQQAHAQHHHQSQLENRRTVARQTFWHSEHWRDDLDAHNSGTGAHWSRRQTR